MKKPLAFSAAFVALAALGACDYAFLVPKIGHATEAEIMAALPAALKVTDAPDPDGEARYARLIALAKRLDRKALPMTGIRGREGRSTPANEATLREIDALIRAGGLRAPESKGDVLYPELAAFKDAAKLMALAATEARKRGDRAACGRWVAMGLRYAKALEGSGGVVIQQLVAVAIDGIAVRSAYLAETDGGLDGAGREGTLALLKPRDGTSSAMADAMRRDFVWGWMPVLLDPKGHEKELYDYVAQDPLDDEVKPKPPQAGTYDPIATARLGGAIYAATIADLRRRPSEVRHDDVRLVEAAAKGLPVRPEASHEEPSLGRTAALFKYRAAMNAGTNTLGRQQASIGVLTGIGSATAREAANENLVRAVILLRMGRTAAVPDPYGKGDLRLDPKRKIVWSVGVNGNDNGGQIGKGFESGAPDLGYPYGDHGWEVLHPPSPTVLRPGFPPGMPGN